MVGVFFGSLGFRDSSYCSSGHKGLTHLTVLHMERKLFRFVKSNNNRGNILDPESRLLVRKMVRINLDQDLDLNLDQDKDS